MPGLYLSSPFPSPPSRGRGQGEGAGVVLVVRVNPRRPKHMPIRFLALSALAALTLAACSSDRDAAAAFSRAALYAFHQDFITEPVTDHFTAAELSVLERHRDLLEPMVQEALSHDSAGAARLVAHFKFRDTLPHLRWRLFQPGHPY